MSRDDFLTFALGQGVRTAALPADFSLLITDTLESPGTFLLTHFISRALRQPRKTLLVGFSHTFEHYSAILKKSGIQLANERTFTFVDANDVGNTLLELYLSIEVALSAMEGALVVLDDLSSLLWAGHPAREVAQLFANVRALVSQSGGSLVVLQHGDDLIAVGDSDDAYLFRRGLQQSDLWLQTTSLSSQTRGELAIHRGPALVDDFGIVERSGATALQYKLEEAGAVFSVKGLGKGFF